MPRDLTAENENLQRRLADAERVIALAVDPIAEFKRNPLTPHFSYAELTVTQQTFTNRPGLKELVNLFYLCEMVLEPIRTAWGVLQINSGYRSPEVNAWIHGEPHSQHMRGEAADFAPLASDLQAVFAWLVGQSGILFDQAIIYPNHGFIHVSCAPGREPRREALICSNTITGEKHYRPYRPGEFQNA